MPTAAAETSSPGRPPEIALLLRGPQLWWAYLAVLSNPLFQSFARYRRVVCTDNVVTLRTQLALGAPGTKFLLLFWDGIQPCAQLPVGLAELCRAHGVTALVVGSNQCGDLPEVHPLYAEGAFQFDTGAVRFDAETSARIHKAKLRNRLTPVRNVLKRSGSVGDALRLLLGRRQVVFCGGYGLNAKLLGMLNNRYGAAPVTMLQHTWSVERTVASPDDVFDAVRDDFAVLLESFQTGGLASDYFVAAVRLVDRGFLLQQVRLAGLPLYTNQFSDHFIDVYSTPAYGQHVFLDFGSTISAANYPRLADLSYYRKRTLRVDLSHDAEAIARSIESGEHGAELQTKWALLQRQIAEVM